MLVERHPHRTEHGGAGSHRHRHVEQIGVEGVGSAGAAGALTGQGLGDLGARGEVAGHRIAGVDLRYARGIGHHHAGAGAALVELGRARVERGAVLQRVLVGHGEHRGVALHVVGQPLVLALRVEDAEGHLEHEEHHEGDGQVAEEDPAGHEPSR